MPTYHTCSTVSHCIIVCCLADDGLPGVMVCYYTGVVVLLVLWCGVVVSYFILVLWLTPAPSPLLHHYHITLHHTSPHHTTLHGAAPHHTTLHYTATLHHTTPQYTTQHTTYYCCSIHRWRYFLKYHRILFKTL